MRGVKTTQYVRQEKAIAAADTTGIRERIMWAIRLLADSDFFTSGGQMKAGRADGLIQAYKAAGRKISQREIQYRLRAARTYRTESQIAQISARFENWSSVIAADFPEVDPIDGEPAADHRTEAERRTDLARALAVAGEIGSDQLALFPLDRYEPAVATLKEISEYAAEMAELTARFQKRDAERSEYLEDLIAAVDGDMSTTWQEAHIRAFGEDVTA